jgi:gluconate 5-dehydrogenase
MSKETLPGIKQFDLSGKGAIITGGSKGLGLAMAAGLASAGASVMLVNRNAEEGASAARQLKEQYGQKAISFSADITNLEQTQAMAAAAAETFGKIDILINSAGINIRGASDELSPSDWDAVVAVNLKAPFLCARLFGPGMCERGWGRVINLGSIMSVIALPGRAPYASAKAGVLGLTRVLALEWATRGVTVNAICPGPFATDMNKQLLSDPEKYKAFVEKIPMGRWGELHEVAGAALFLASDAASYVTGSALFVDGGWTAQ